MASPKRTKAQRERDLRDTARWHVQGLTHQQIADRIAADPERPYEISRVQVTLDVKAIHLYWKAEMAKDRHELIQKELARLQALEDTYWDAWERSCLDAEETTTFRERGSGGTGDKDRAIMKRRGQSGDPRFLAGVERCQQRRMIILGIEEPPKAPVDENGQAVKAVLILPDNGFNKPPDNER